MRQLNASMSAEEVLDILDKEVAHCNEYGMYNAENARVVIKYENELHIVITYWWTTDTPAMKKAINILWFERTGEVL